jgi:anti-sigma B factor antagonist
LAVVINHTELQDQRAAVVDIEGPLDSYTSPDFEDYINRLLEKKIVFILFDGSKMEYVSSEGIGLLLFLQKKISEANGFFVIFNLPEEISTLYSLLGFDKIFRIAPSRAEALQVMDRQIELRDKGLSEEAEPPAPEEPEAPVAAAVIMDTPAPAERPAEKAKTFSGEEGSASRSKIVTCATCRSQIRVYRDGDYLCPYCGTELTVAGTAPAKQADAPVANDQDFGQLIVECGSCKSLIRVKKPGTYVCADCGARFSVSGDQTVKF